MKAMISQNIFQDIRPIATSFSLLISLFVTRP